MPIYATKEAREFWKQGHARTLAATHFAHLKTNPDGTSDSEYRRKTCAQIVKGAAINAKAVSYQQFLQSLDGGNTRHIFAKLQARLILNAGDGVIENGGICLDRTGGSPYIPGSAIKACARRYASHQLGYTQDPKEKAQLLSTISLIFGYGDTEWKSGRKTNEKHPHGGASLSDFWLAMVPLENAGKEHDEERDRLWKIASEDAAQLIFTHLNHTAKSSEKTIASQLPNLAGAITFLPAYPISNAKIEADVLTPHHTEYYAGNKTIATDDENPVPIHFPTVAKGTSYQFAITENIPQNNSDLLRLACTWLEEGLQLFGLGAKTNAGYGWFEPDRPARQKADNERQQQDEAIAREKQLAILTPEERAQEELKELSHEDFVCIIKNLENETSEQQKVVCLMLSQSKKDQWKDWKKAKKWKDRIPLIRQIAKTHGIELI